MKQIKLPLPKPKEPVTWGGKRKGAGRKPSTARPGVKHETRPDLDGRTPVHVTLRLTRSVPNLRSQRCINVIRRALAAAKDQLGMRLVHYAVQRDHLHMMVEPNAKRSLSRATQGLTIRLAKQLNAELGRSGKVFADRYHARPLRTPRQTRTALAYVLLQVRRHAAKRGDPLPIGMDPCSSAPCFTDWTVDHSPRAGPWSDTVMPAATWLLSTGWKRHGLIDPLEVPGRRRSRG